MRSKALDGDVLVIRPLCIDETLASPMVQSYLS
jgi:hypothetical protein